MNKEDKSKNKKGQQKKEKKEEVPNNLQDEIAKYLAQTEKVVQKQQEADKEITELRNKEQLALDAIKALPPEEMFNKIVDIINEALIENENSKKAKKDIDAIKNQTSFFYDNMQNLNQQIIELDAHNKSILDQIKVITEESKKLVTIEEEKTKDIQRQCDDFKMKVKKEFDQQSNDIIVKDNEILKGKLEECTTSTQKIRQNIEDQFKLKENDTMNFQDLFKNQIHDKLDDLNKQSGEFDKENKKLKDDLETSKKKYDSLSNSMKKFNKKFESSKREYEKTIKDLMSLGKESQELRSADLVSIQKEIDKNDVILKDLVARNKDFQNKIKELKEK